MARRFGIGVAALVLVLARSLAAQSVDDIIAKNLAAKGGLDKLKAIQSVKITGRMTVGPGIEAPLTLEKKRPNRMRIDFTVQGMTGTQAYDGTSGWAVIPFGGRKDPDPMGPDDLKNVQEQAEFDGPLVDYHTKGHTVELVGKEPVEGADAYKLKVTLQNGDIRYIYIDAAQFLDVKVEGRRKLRGTEVETETALGDYKQVDGVLFPFSIESTIKGTPQKQRISIEKVELNVPIDDTRFTMPSTKPQP
jgi:outer membrane lipoprotein-sorting protein